MKAVISNNEGPEAVRLGEVEAPRPGPEEVLVNVRASALNRADLMQTLGMYPAPPGVVANIPGLEYSGEVAAVGQRVTRWRAGDRVMGLVAGGAWAECLVTHERECLPMPKGMAFSDAAALPEAFSTAFDALVLQANMSVESQVLIHAVASGVGTAAVQLCTLYGARSIGTGRNAQKLERAKALGLREAILVVDGQFSAQVKAATQGRGCDVVLDLVGGEYFGQSIEAMAPKGTLMLVGLVGGASTSIPLRTLLSRRQRIIGTALRSRPLEEKIAVARAFEQRLLPAFEQGQLRSVVDAVLSMTDIKDGLSRMAQNQNFGKLVLTW